MFSPSHKSVRLVNVLCSVYLYSQTAQQSIFDKLISILFVFNSRLIWWIWVENDIISDFGSGCYSYRKIAFILASKNKIFKTVHDSEQLCADKIKHKNCANSRLFISLFEFTLRRMELFLEQRFLTNKTLFFIQVMAVLIVFCCLYSTSRAKEG